MRNIQLFCLTILISCSSNQMNISRDPSSDTKILSCEDLVKGLYSKSGDGLSQKQLLDKGILDRKDLSILKGSILSQSLPTDLKDKEQVEISYLLIKKQFPHFEEEQILAHFEMLKSYCGI